MKPNKKEMASSHVSEKVMEEGQTREVVLGKHEEGLPNTRNRGLQDGLVEKGAYCQGC